MWGFFKFVILLLLISFTLVTIDQYNKKRARWKLWAVVAFFTCMLSALTFLASPHDIALFTSGAHHTGLVSGSSGKAAPGENSGASETPQGSENDGAVNQGAGGNKNTGQGDGQNTAQQTGGKGGPQDGQQSGQGQSQAGQQASGQSGANGSRQNTQQASVIPQDLLLPVDEASLNPSFLNFRDSLLAAIQNKDLAFLKDHVSPTIRYSFGINNGINGFLHEWQLDTNPAKSGIWHELDQVLSLGGSFDKNKTVFTAPYVFSKFPDTIDSFENVAVIRQNVSIHSAPDANSSVIMGLSYKILKVADSKLYKSNGAGDSTTWRKVETSAGAGYIDNEYIRSPIDYRAQFRQENGQWKMIFFVAGD